MDIQTDNETDTTLAVFRSDEAASQAVPTSARLPDVRCGCEQGSRPCVVVLSSDRSLVAFVRAVVGEAHISVCGSQQWETVDDRVLDRRPTLLVLDLSVGQQDCCWATLEHLASDPQLRSIPVVVCATVSWLLDGHADALARKGVHVWREPFDPAELLTTVDATIQAPTNRRWSIHSSPVPTNATRRSTRGGEPKSARTEATAAGK
jgi:CheY-like chemotaxis protein